MSEVIIGYTDAKKVLGYNIKKFREELRITQEQLADQVRQLTQERIDQTTISSWEIGRTAPKLHQLCALVSIFGATIDVLLGIEPPKEVYREYGWERAIAMYIVEKLLETTTRIFLDESQVSVACGKALIDLSKEGQGVPQLVLTNNLRLCSLWEDGIESPRLKLIGRVFENGLFLPEVERQPDDVDLAIVEVSAIAFEKEPGIYLNPLKASYKKSLLLWPTKHRGVVCPPEGIGRIIRNYDRMDLSTLLQSTSTCSILTAWPHNGDYLSLQLRAFENFIGQLKLNMRENLKLIVLDRERKNFKIYGSFVCQLERRVQEAREQGDKVLLVKALTQLAWKLVKMKRYEEAKQSAREALEHAKEEGVSTSGKVWKRLGDVFFHLEDRPLSSSIDCYKEALKDLQISQMFKKVIQTNLSKAEAYTDL